MGNLEPAAIVGGARLFHADCRDVLRSLPDNSIDSVVTDPPYALVSIVKRFGGANSKPANGNEAYQRASAGFMGKQWDTGEVAFSEEFWAEVLRVLKPGGHVVAFSGTRTYHRMAVAIEDAGFEIRDQLGWLYGSGFPKSHNQHGEWEGWGTALKPAWEPICLARKPMTGTIAGNLVEWGVGALNIDGCRVDAPDGVPVFDKSNKRPGNTFDVGSNRTGETSTLGRWPANIIHDGSEEVLAAFPDSNGSGAARTLKRGKRDGEGWGMADEPGELRDAGTGSAARFFYCAKASRKDRDEGLEAFAPKFAPTMGNGIGGKEHDPETATPKKNVHPTVKPTSLMQWLCRLVTPPGGTILDPFMGSGSTGKAALLEGFNFVGCEREDEYMPIAQARIAAALRPVAAQAQLGAANDNQPQADLFTAPAQAGAA